MPIYEYTCLSCGEDFEFLHKSISQPGEAVCPHCQASKAQKKFSVFAKVGAAENSPLPAGEACSGGMGPCGVPGCASGLN